MVLYSCFLITVFVIVALLYELCKVCKIHYAVTVNANPSHRDKNYYADIVYITFFYGSATMFYCYRHLVQFAVAVLALIQSADKKDMVLFLIWVLS